MEREKHFPARKRLVSVRGTRLKKRLAKGQQSRPILPKMVVALTRVSHDPSPQKVTTGCPFFISSLSSLLPFFSPRENGGDFFPREPSPDTDRAQNRRPNLQKPFHLDFIEPWIDFTN